MSRIPEDEIERLKRAVSLERLVKAAGIELRRHGSDLLGLCPFHDDREPSLVVTPGKNLWHCLGACQTGGSVVDWVMRTKGVSFRHAVELLKADHPALGAPAEKIVLKDTTSKLDAPISPGAADREVLGQVVDYYHDTLKQSPEALKYLESRGLTHPEMVQRFKLGFANRTPGYRLPEKNRKAGAEMRGRLQSLGVLRESGHEHFNGSLVIPVINLSGDVAGMYGRKITPNLREGTPLHLYLPGGHRGVWNEEALVASKEIILCESLIDALTFWCAGFRNVTASYGVSGFTEDHRTAFQKHGVRQVWIAYDRILEDFERCGIVGEHTNALTGYLAAVSRHLESPLAIVVQSSSAAGKSSLMDAVLAFVPEEERIQYSAMTGQSLYYMGEMDLKHKVLAIVEEEGASRASYALKLLQSEGVLSIASTGKDPATGKLVTHQYRVEGPVMIFLTTTAIDLDEELLNRCLVLTVNEDREQTQAIHRLQREQQTLEGLLKKRDRQAILRRHRNAQRLLKPLYVVNPFVGELTFPDALTRMRRDHMKYLTLIRSIALLHQHQRPVKNERGVSYVEVTREDIATADRLMGELMRRSLDDLPPQTRRLLELIGKMISGREGFHFSRRDVRAHTGWSATQVRVHLDRLQEMEYLIVHHGGRGQTFLYEYDANLAGSGGHLTGPKRPQNGGIAEGWRPAETPVKIAPNGVFHGEAEKCIYAGA